MVKCANCSKDALYSYPVSGNYVIHYCQYHLPRFLTNRKNSGQLPLIKPVQESVAPKAKKVVQQPIVAEEAVVEETPAVDDATN
jgi:hypothetical protein